MVCQGKCAQHILFCENKNWAVMVHTFNASTLEAEAGRSQWDWGQTDLQSGFQDIQDCYRKTLIQKTKSKQIKQNPQNNNNKNNQFLSWDKTED